MSLLNIPAYDLENESDVEQKFLLPTLIHPSFLAIPTKAILTKKSMGSLSFVEKTALPRNYIPDYAIFFDGYPVCIIEAKAPDVSVKKAISEARLYADTLNKHFPAKINPIEVVVGCNGQELALGPVDSNEAEIFSVRELVIGSARLDRLRKLLGVERLREIGDKYKKQAEVIQQTSPAKFLDAQLFLDRIKPNVLAPYLTPLYEMFFRAEDPEKIQLILERAYVDTAELREYDLVIHTMLRQMERGLPAEYLIRHKNNLDRKNPLFKERSREAENVVRAVNHAVNATAGAASKERARIIRGAKAKRASAQRR